TTRAGLAVPGQLTTSRSRTSEVRALTRNSTVGVAPGTSTSGETLNSVRTGRCASWGRVPRAGTPPLPFACAGAAAISSPSAAADVASAFTPVPRSRHRSSDSSSLRRRLQQRELARLRDQDAVARPQLAVLLDEP